MPLEKSVLVPLTADETFALLTGPDGLRRWQVITARADLRAGGSYRWTIIPGSTASGTFTEIDAGGLDGMVSVAGNELPATTAAGILSIEFLVHAWDFAQVTGQQVDASAAVSQHVVDATQQIITPEGRRNVGFGAA